MFEQNELEDELRTYIGAIRQGNGDWLAFKEFVEENIECICREANLRWLASICDTYADEGEPLERRNAMMISILVKMEKIAQTYAHWRLEYPEALGAPAEDKHRKIGLTEGLNSFNLDIGDAPNTMFGRMAAMVSESPVLSAILGAVKDRLAKSDSILGNLNQRHGHVFEDDYSWIVSEDYQQYRDSGRIPRHRFEKWL